MMDLDPVRARTSLALRALLFGAGTIQERVEEACDAILLLQSRELPEAMRDEFVLLLQRITAVSAPSALSAEEAVSLAEAIVVFHDHVQRSE